MLPVKSLFQTCAEHGEGIGKYLIGTEITLGAWHRAELGALAESLGADILGHPEILLQEAESKWGNTGQQSKERAAQRAHSCLELTWL